MNIDRYGNKYWYSNLPSAVNCDSWVDPKDLVSIEVAKNLKSLGFNRKSKGAILYTDGSWLIENASANLNWNESVDSSIYDPRLNCMTIPTIDITLQWLKEEHNITIEIRYQEYLREYYYYITHNSKTYGYIDNSYIEMCINMTEKERLVEAINRCLITCLLKKKEED